MNGTAIAGTKSNQLKTDCQMIEIANPSSGEWQQFMAGRKNWSVQTSFLVTAVADIRKLLTIGTTVTLVFRDRSNTSSVSGQAIVKSCTIESTRGSLAHGDFAFQGTGELS